MVIPLTPLVKDIHAKKPKLFPINFAEELFITGIMVTKLGMKLLINHHKGLCQAVPSGYQLFNGLVNIQWIDIRQSVQLFQ